MDTCLINGEEYVRVEPNKLAFVESLPMFLNFNTLGLLSDQR
jgi:hypothetical protein